MTVKLQETKHRRLVSRRNLRTLLWMPVGMLVALLVPPALWPRLTSVLALCRSQAGRVLSKGRAKTSKRRAILGAVLGKSLDDAEWARLQTRTSALEFEQNLWFYRALLLPRWRFPVEVHGRERIDAALASGRGVVLWVATSVFQTLAVKQALADCGYGVVQLSRPHHGVGGGESVLATRFLDPLWRSVENRYLAGRCVLREEDTKDALNQLRDVLAGNGIVSIMITPQGRRPLRVPFRQAALRVAPGAPILARRTGAVLLPVVGTYVAGVFVIRVLAAEDVGRGTKEDAVRRAVTQAAKYIEHHFVDHHPEQISLQAFEVI